jgi:hypothetical protein
MSEDVLNIPVFLDNIRTNDKYREEFLAVAQDVKADVVSFQGNPNCGCRRKITEYVDKNKEKIEVKSFFAKWKAIIPELFVRVNPKKGESVQPTANGVTTVQVVKEEGEALPAPRAVKVMTGHVVEIPATPDEYKTLMEHAKQDMWVYRGLSVMEKKGADGHSDWLVFFY